MKCNSYIILITFFVCVHSVINESVEKDVEPKDTFFLRVVKARVADIDGAGMSGGKFGIISFGGGSIGLKICDRRTGECCETGTLNSRDDNWEEGETNYFAGKQLGQCENHPLQDVQLTVRHKGNDGCHLDSIVLMSSKGDRESFHCPVGKKLDGSEQLTISCYKQGEYQVTARGGAAARACNGSPRFCALRFDEFTFGGTHNSGTGEASRQLNCFFKNQDLDIREQLDLGIRFFDLDVIHSTSLPYCNGLETGHGSHPRYGVYQCFGELFHLLLDVRGWMDENPGEVIVLYFGDIEKENFTFPSLREMLLEVFSRHESVKMNGVYKREGYWPTLGEAVASNARVFVFVRSKFVVKTDYELVRENQIDIKKQNTYYYPYMDGQAVVLSTFQSGKVGDDCQFTVDNARSGCREQAAAAQFVKLAVFGSPGKGDRLGTECLWDLARKCNPRIRDAVDACLESASVVNFVQADYPNYPASRYLTLVDYCKTLNLDRARRLERRRRLYTRLSQDVRRNMRRRGRSRTLRYHYNKK